jgi:DNA-binding transcriptional MerR regulator
MTVKQVAESVGLPSRTIRYYDRIGLVSADERSDAGYRLYSPEEEGKLRFIRRAKALGFSLEDIRGLMDAAERGCCDQVVPEVERLLEQKVQEIDARIAELSGFRDRLVSYAAGRGSGCGCKSTGAFCGCLDDVSQTTVSG